MPARAATQPVRARTGMVVCQDRIAAQVGADVLRDSGTAMDAAVATAFALAVTHPIAGNIGGGGFLLARSAAGESTSYDFRETAPAAARPEMWVRSGTYDPVLHHDSIRSVGVPGTVAGLHMAWKDGGRLPWARLLKPAIALARDGFVVTDPLARALRLVMPEMEAYPATLAQFTKPAPGGVRAFYEIGDVLKQPDLARTLQRISDAGPAGFYSGETADLIVKEMKARDGLITREDLKSYVAKKRAPVRGTYRGCEIIGLPPPSSGGTAIVEMLNVLEGYDLAGEGGGFGSALTVHRMSEAMRRAFADRARWMGDPDFNPDIPVPRLTSKDYAAALRATIRDDAATPSSAGQLEAGFAALPESGHTTHLSVVDRVRAAVSLTFTLEDSWGSKMVVPGAGFLLNDEMGDFNGVPGLTDVTGMIGTSPNLAGPGRRMLSSMSPTIVARDGRLLLVSGSPGGRSIINTVLETIVNVLDHGMNAQEAVDAPRFHHQWLPDRIQYEKFGLSPDTRAILTKLGHTLQEAPEPQGKAQVIVYNVAEDLLEGAADRRDAGSAAVAP